MSAWWLLVGPPIAVSALLVAAICRAARRGDQPAPAEPPRLYVPPPITDAYVNAEFAILRWHYHHTATHQEKP